MPKGPARSVSLPPATPPAAAPAPPARLSERRLDIIMAVSAVILAAAVFLGTLHGEFVYDDEVIIQANSLIQTPGQVWASLTSDVFAYRSATGEANSPYWRPASVLWFVVHHRLYGLDSTAGWHAGSIALHALVTLLAFLVMRRLGLRPLIAGAAAWIFAVHPTRTESVAWVSGVGDLLVAAGLLGSFWFVLGIIDRRDDAGNGPGIARRTPWGLWAGALACYALALGSKEFSILFALLVFAAGLRWRPAPGDAPGSALPPEPARRVDLSSWRSAAVLTLPFLALAGVYLFIRAGIVASETTEGPMGGMATAVKSLPITGAFYIRQMLLPYSIGPTYPVSPVLTPSLFNFVFPAILVGGVGAGMLWLALGRVGSRAALCGLALFLFAIAPAAMASAVSPALMVQDRYLYLPLLGFCIVVLCGARELLARRAGVGAPRAEAILAVCAAVVCIPLAAQTFRYSAAWTTSEALWAWATAHNPSSGYAWANYGVTLTRNGKYEEAGEALDRAIAIRRSFHTVINRVEVSIRLGEFDEAEPLVLALLEDLKTRPPSLDVYLATEQLVRIHLLRDGNVDKAAELLRAVREQVPNFRAMITDRLAVILIVDGRRDEALAELEAVRPHVATDRSQEARWVLYRLGQLYAERGRLSEAEAAFREFLVQTEGTGNAMMLDARPLAAEAIEVIRRGSQTPPSSSPPGPAPSSPPTAPAGPTPGGK